MERSFITTMVAATIKTTSEIISFINAICFISRMGFECYRIRLTHKNGETKVYNFPIKLMEYLCLYDMIKENEDMNTYVSKPIYNPNIQKIFELLQGINDEQNIYTKFITANCLLAQNGYGIESSDQESPALDINCIPLSNNIIGNYFLLVSILESTSIYTSKFRDNLGYLKAFNLTDSDIEELFIFCDYMDYKHLDRLCIQIYNEKKYSLYHLIVKNIKFQKYLYEDHHHINKEMLCCINQTYKESSSSVTPILIASVISGVSLAYWYDECPELRSVMKEIMETPTYKELFIYNRLSRQSSNNKLIYDDPQDYLKQNLVNHDYYFALHENTPLTRFISGKMKIWYKDDTVINVTKSCIDMFKYATDQEYKQYIQGINPKLNLDSILL